MPKYTKPQRYTIVQKVNKIMIDQQSNTLMVGKLFRKKIVTKKEITDQTKYHVSNVKESFLALAQKFVQQQARNVKNVIKC